MTAPQEPLVMTLGEALSMLQQRGYRLVPPEEGTDSWGTTRIANWDAPDHEFDTWPEAVSDALGVPVVARDEAAELRDRVAELERTNFELSEDSAIVANENAELRAALEGLVPVALALTDLAVSGFDLPPGTVTAIAKARAALAATEGKA